MSYANLKVIDKPVRSRHLVKDFVVPRSNLRNSVLLSAGQRSLDQSAVIHRLIYAIAVRICREGFFSQDAARFYMVWYIGQLTMSHVNCECPARPAHG